ncbi:APC family permease [Streptomyces hokutonensis]|uniref:APC family permease n=1 Tax=Streptomyces hokutonensis TaxID=1306990 RepID=UPI0033CC19E6
MSSSHPTEAVGLRSNSVGATGIAFFVVAAAAPLTCVIGITPLSFAYGVGAGVPVTYLLAGVVLAVFAVGYVAMSRHISSPGAFYAYIAQGLGKPAGIGAAFVSVIAYLLGMAALAAFAGFALSGSLDTWFGWHAPWYLCSLLVLLLTTFMSVREISLGAKVLGALMVLEVTVLLVLGAAILIHGGASGITAHSLRPAGVFTGGLGISFAFAYASFIGFEQTAIYAEEARDRARSISRATYLALGAITLFYTFVSWTLVQAYGDDKVAGAARHDPAGFVSVATGTYLGACWNQLVAALIVTSSFAAVLAFHNATARYLFALGRERIAPAALSRTHRRSSSPYVACLLTGAFQIVFLGACAFRSVDPFLQVFSWGAAAATVGMILLQAACSLAVVGFFRRTGLETRVWHRLLAPLLGFAGLGLTLCLISANFDLLVGTDTGVAGVLVPGVYLLIGLLGCGYAWWLRTARPQVYADFAARVAEPAAVEEVSSRASS